MTDTVLRNPVMLDIVTLHAPRPTHAQDVQVFTTDLPAGAVGSPPHRHARMSDTFEGLEGCVTFQVCKTVRILQEGGAVTVRPNTIHGFRNASDAPAVLRCTVTPGMGFEQFLRGIQASAEAGHTNAAGLARLLLDADCHFPGPSDGTAALAVSRPRGAGPHRNPLISFN